MVEVHVTHDSLVLEVKGTHKFWALKSRLEIPLEHVKGIHADPSPAMGWFEGLKIAGTDIPNMFRAGLFWQEGNKVFWDVRHPEKTVVIEMKDESCARLIVEVRDPEEAVQEIRRALQDYQASKMAASRELEEFLKGEQGADLSTLTGEDESLKQGR